MADPHPRGPSPPLAGPICVMVVTAPCALTQQSLTEPLLVLQMPEVPGLLETLKSTPGIGEGTMGTTPQEVASSGG